MYWPKKFIYKPRLQIFIVAREDLQTFDVNKVIVVCFDHEQSYFPWQILFIENPFI